MDTKFLCPVCYGSGEIPPHWHAHDQGGRQVVGGTWCPWCEGAKYLNHDDFVQATGSEPDDDDIWDG